MGTLTLYILEWAFGLILMLAAYKLLLGGTTFHRFNRMVLLGILYLSALPPALHIEMESNPIAIHDSHFAHHIERMDTLALTKQGLAFVETDETMETTTITPLSADANTYWPLLLVGAYVCYLAFFFTSWVRSTLKMFRFLHRCRRHRIGRWIQLCVHSLPYGAFNWMNCIVLAEEEKRYSHNIAMLHELAHVRNLHFVDLIVVNLCALINPACWLLLRELKTVHEYEADALILARERINSTHYQLQLIRLSVGNEAYSLASTLNFNLKKRLIMMKRKASNPWRRVCVFLFIPIAGFIILACGTTTAHNHAFDIIGTWRLKGESFANESPMKLESLQDNYYRRMKFILPDNTFFYIIQIISDSADVHNYVHSIGTYEYQNGKYVEHYTNGTCLDMQMRIVNPDSYTNIREGITETWERITDVKPEYVENLLSDIKRQPSAPNKEIGEALNAFMKSHAKYKLGIRHDWNLHTSYTVNSIDH